jgi:enoyl-CoA hydratase/carnithine racemase
MRPGDNPALQEAHVTAVQDKAATQPDEATVLTELRDGVGIISLNRPRKHNALNDASRAALAEAFLWARTTDAVRAVLLRGEGRSFCSGRDRSGFLDPGQHGSHFELISAAQAVRLEQVGIGKPSVCAMQGHVIGAGAELALGCDIRIAASDLRYSFPEVGFGVVSDTGSSHLLTRLLGPARAKWLLLSGVPLGAEEAVAWGLAEWQVPRELLESRAFEIAVTLASRPPEAARRQKALIDDSMAEALREGMKREMVAQLGLFEGAEFAALQNPDRTG